MNTPTSTMPMSNKLEPIHLSRPQVLLSQCLQGDPVRYDGAHKQHPLILELLPNLMPKAMCPEVAAGMGVPRPAIRRPLVDSEEIIALAASGQPLANKLQVTSQQLAGCDSAQDAIAAILKVRSPSCGIASSPLFNGEGDILTLGDGLFVQALRQRQPHLLMVSEEQLHDAKSCVQFLRLCQLALASKLKLLSENWLRHLAKANALHQGSKLGLQTIARNLGSQSAELNYLELLPFVVRD